MKMWLIFITFIILGPLNFIFYKLLYDSYGNRGAFFVNQGVNIIFILLGGAVLSFVSYRGDINDATRKTSHLKFVVIGVLDCLAGFFCSMGAANTSG